MQRDVSARVGTWTARVRAPDGALATIGRDALERATREALEAVAARRPQEVIALRQVRVDLRAVRTGSASWSLSAADLRRTIEHTLAGRADSARDRAVAHHARAFVDAEIAWYASVGVHLAHAIAHACEPRPWPVAQRTADGALDELLRSGRDDRGDALAELAAIWAPRSSRDDLRSAVVSLAGRLEALGDAAVAHLAAPWLAAREDREALIDAIPIQLLEVVPSCEIVARGGTDPMVVALVALAFDIRPAARDARPIARELARMLEPGVLRSRAGGLILWDGWLESWGLADAIRDAYPDARSARLARWALARALEDVTMDDADPLALLFAGEDPDRPIAARTALRAIDAEPLHRAALAWCAAWRPLLVDVAPWPWGSVALADDVVLDAHADAPEVACADLVARLVARGATPIDVSLAPELGARGAAVFEVDVPSLPEPWRRAARATASAVRAELRRRVGLELRDLRGLDARIEMSTGRARIDARRMETLGASWPDRVQLGRHTLEIEAWR